jgi:hypothetical protein
MRGAIVLGLALLAPLSPAPAQATDADRFDGHWDVTLACPASSDGALAFAYQFTAEVSAGHLHGENGQAGMPGWLALDGPIQADGTATFDASGITGRAGYNVHSTQAGVAYRHSVTAHFDDRHGDGRWVTTRTCDFTFDRS